MSSQSSQIDVLDVGLAKVEIEKKKLSIPLAGFMFYLHGRSQFILSSSSDTRHDHNGFAELL